MDWLLVYDESVEYRGPIVPLRTPVTKMLARKERGSTVSSTAGSSSYSLVIKVSLAHQGEAVGGVDDAAPPVGLRRPVPADRGGRVGGQRT